MSITYVEGTQGYVGPAGVVFTPEELLLIWQSLVKNPTPENQPLANRIKQFLEQR